MRVFVLELTGISFTLGPKPSLELTCISLTLGPKPSLETQMLKTRIFVFGWNCYPTPQPRKKETQKVDERWGEKQQ